jgi:hypothetical protein
MHIGAMIPVAAVAAGAGHAPAASARVDAFLVDFQDAVGRVLHSDTLAVKVREAR